jgi:hypothetical protein
MINSCRLPGLCLALLLTPASLHPDGLLLHDGDMYVGVVAARDSLRTAPDSHDWVEIRESASDSTLRFPVEDISLVTLEVATEHVIISMKSRPFNIHTQPRSKRGSTRTHKLVRTTLINIGAAVGTVALVRTEGDFDAHDTSSFAMMASGIAMAAIGIDLITYHLPMLSLTARAGPSLGLVMEDGDAIPAVRWCIRF